jgi:hypothetical protein
VKRLTEGLETKTKKPLRAAEQLWAEKGINTRSTMWSRARGGAPMTAACLTLLELSKRPMWPWRTHCSGLLAEGFPAAQLKLWRLPFQAYGGAEDRDRANRNTIIMDLRTRISLCNWIPILQDSADALDAVLCALAAVALSAGTLASRPGPLACVEGWIAISRDIRWLNLIGAGELHR